MQPRKNKRFDIIHQANMKVALATQKNTQTKHGKGINTAGLCMKPTDIQCMEDLYLVVEKSDSR